MATSFWRTILNITSAFFFTCFVLTVTLRWVLVLTVRAMLVYTIEICWVRYLVCWTLVASAIFFNLLSRLTFCWNAIVRVIIRSYIVILTLRTRSAILIVLVIGRTVKRLTFVLIVWTCLLSDWAVLTFSIFGNYLMILTQRIFTCFHILTRYPIFRTVRTITISVDEFSITRAFSFNTLFGVLPILL